MPDRLIVCVYIYMYVCVYVCVHNRVDFVYFYVYNALVMDAEV